MQETGYWVALIACLLIAAVAHGDTVELKDGSKLTGKLISRNDTLISFDANTTAGRIRRRLIPASRVALIKVDKPKVATTSRSDKTYFLIPLKGSFGEEIKASLVAECLEYSKNVSPDAIVIEIDSPGGLVSEMLAMMKLMSEWQQKESVPIVALVNKDAISAAAMTAMSIEHIYMVPGSAMGASLIISTNMKTGKTVAVDETRAGEKEVSAYRAQCRSAAEVAGNSMQVVEAMIRPEIVLSWAKDGKGKPMILSGLPSAQPEGDYSMPPQLLSASDRILTLTSREARRIGVTKGVVKDIDELGETLGMKGWRSASPYGVSKMTGHVRKINAVTGKYGKLITRAAENLYQFRTAPSDQLYKMERLLVTTRESLVNIKKLAADQPIVVGLIKRHFPHGVDERIEYCDHYIKILQSVRRSSDKKNTILLPGAIDLLKLADPAKHSHVPGWGKGADGIHFGSGYHAVLLAPVKVTGDYELYVQMSSSVKFSTPAITFPVGSRYMTFVLSVGGGKYCGLEVVKGRHLTERRDRGTAHPSPMVPNHLHIMRIIVRLKGKRATVQTYLDGRSFVRWEGSPEDLSQPSHWKIPGQWLFGFGALRERRRGAVTFKVAKVRSLAGGRIVVGK